jgi:hypothetical protein
MADALTEGGPRRRPKLQDVRALVGVGLLAPGPGGRLPASKGDRTPPAWRASQSRLSHGPADPPAPLNRRAGCRPGPGCEAKRTGRARPPGTATGGSRACRMSLRAEPALRLGAKAPGGAYRLVSRNNSNVPAPGKNDQSGAREDTRNRQSQDWTGTTLRRTPRAPLPHQEGPNSKHPAGSTDPSEGENTSAPIASRYQLIY